MIQIGQLATEVPLGTLSSVPFLSPSAPAFCRGSDSVVEECIRLLNGHALAI